VLGSLPVCVSFHVFLVATIQTSWVGCPVAPAVFANDPCFGFFLRLFLLFMLRESCEIQVECQKFDLCGVGVKFVFCKYLV